MTPHHRMILSSFSKELCDLANRITDLPPLESSVLVTVSGFGSFGFFNGSTGHRKRMLFRDGNGFSDQFWISFSSLSVSPSQNEMAIPEFPALPVLPILCT
jgi:hypothetical protein